MEAVGAKPVVAVMMGSQVDMMDLVMVYCNGNICGVCICVYAFGRI